MVSFAFLAIIVAVSYELLRAVYLSSRLSRQVMASEARWRALLSNVRLAVVSLDAQSRITLVNPFFERTLGYRAAELGGRPISDLLPAADAEEFRERWRIAAERGPRPLARWAFRQASGDLRTFEWSTVRLLDGEGEFAGFLTVGADITERLKAETDLARVRHDLEHLSRTNLLGELSSALAHELNQPLTSILSNAQAGRRFLAQATPDLEEIKTILDEIARDDKRAGEVIHRRRALLRKEAPTRTTFALGDAVHEVEQLVRSGMIAGGIRLQVQLGSPTTRVEGVRVEVQQVLMNLILNAAQALKDQASTQREILMTSERSESEIRISVLDNGSGIPSEKLPALFEPFVTSRTDGMGMGLSICRRLIQNNRGRLEAANRAEGGAVFTFTLPVA
jgi:PAS domain S-box-containing protein